MSIQTAIRWVVYAALFSIPFVPLFVADGVIIPNLFFPFITGKGFAFRLLVEIAAAGFVLLAILDKRYRPHFSWTAAIYGALLVWMTIADALAVNPHKAFWSNYERMDGWITLAHVFLFFIILGTFLTVERKWKAWWMWFLSAAAIVCAYGLFQLAGMADIHQGGARVDASLGNAAYLAVYLLFVLAIALWQGIESKGFLRYTLFAFAAIVAIIIFSTATRGAIIGLAGAIALGAVLWMLEAGKKKVRVVAGSVLVGLIVLAGAFVALKDSSFIKQDPTLSRIASISLADGSTRFKLWDMALKGVAERPVFGWGHEGFNYIFQKYYDPSLYAQEPWFDRAHNTYFDWLTAGGVPALLLFLALLGSAIAALYRKGASRPERVLLIAALAAYAFQALFVFDNLISYICLAALLAAAHAVSSRPIAKLESLPEPKEDMFGAVALPIVGAVAVASMWMINVPSMAAAHDLVYGLGYAQQRPDESLRVFKSAIAADGLGQQEVSEQFMTLALSLRDRTEVPAELRKQFIEEALTQMNTQVQRIPHDARLRIQYALGLRGAGKYTESLAQSERALKESPKKQTLMLERGYEFWEAGKVQEARDTFVAAYQLDPSFTELAAYAAAGEIVVGNGEQANAILMEAYGTTDVDNNILVVAYYQAKRYDDLIRTLRIHVEKNPSVDAYIRLASAYVVSGRVSEAYQTAELALTTFPESAAAIRGFIAQLPK